MHHVRQYPYANVAESLRKAVLRNPFLKVFVANGYYDLATPCLATRYTFNHLGLDPTLQDNISMTYYQAGHMMYIHQPSLSQSGMILPASSGPPSATDRRYKPRPL